MLSGDLGLSVVHDSSIPGQVPGRLHLSPLSVRYWVASGAREAHLPWLVALQGTVESPLLAPFCSILDPVGL